MFATGLPHLILRFYGFTSFAREKNTCKLAGFTIWCKAGHRVLTSQDQVRVDRERSRACCIRSLSTDKIQETAF